MLKLLRAYPDGLIQRVGDEYQNEQTHQLVGSHFPPLNRRYHRVVREQLIL